MINNHLNNPFENNKISENKLLKIGDTNLERLKANKPLNGTMLFSLPVSQIFDEMISNTLTARNIYAEFLNTKNLKKSQSEGHTITVNESLKELKSFISRKEGVIADKFLKGTSIYEQFYPQGVSQYSTASKKDFGILAKRFIDTLEIHKDNFEEAMLTEAKAKYNTYIELRTSQLNKIGATKDAISISNEHRRTLELQLYKNLLALLLIYADNPTRVKDFFDESMFKKKGKEEVVEPVNPS